MPDNLIARIPQRLRCFTGPNTESDIEGVVEPGSYPVLTHRENHPDETTDYTQLALDTIEDGESWICSRWQDQRYAEIIEDEPAPASSGIDNRELADDPLSIDEFRLLDSLDLFRDFTYTRTGARYPYEIPGVPPEIVGPPLQNNCCTFVEAFVVKAWLDSPGFSWDSRRHGQAMILSGNDLFSPVTALLETGIADEHPADSIPLPWTVMQGWRPRNGGGHTFIVVARHPPSDRLLTLESTTARPQDGVGFRKLGNLRDFPAGQAPPRWWENNSAPTWQWLRGHFTERRQAALKVRNPQWAMPRD